MPYSLRTSEIGFSLQEPTIMSGQSVLQILTTIVLKEGNSYVHQFTHEDTVFEVTPTVVREAFHLPVYTEYDAPTFDEVIWEFFTQIGYA